MTIKNGSDPSTTDIPETMTAAIYHNFGSPQNFQVEQVPVPQIESHQVLVRVSASSVNTQDLVFLNPGWILLGLIRLSTGFRKPKFPVLGSDIAGTVVKVGDNVTSLIVGDKVYGGSSSMGGYGQYTAVNPKGLAKIPPPMDMQTAGAFPMVGLTALQAIRDGAEIKDGERVLVYGASGGIGSVVVQLCKYYGAEVVGLSSGKNREFVMSLGADSYIDYETQDFTDEEQFGRFDCIIDTASKVPVRRWKHALKDGGRLIDIGSPQMSILAMVGRLIFNKFRKKQFRIVSASYNTEDLEVLNQLVEDGAIQLHVDQVYDLQDLPTAYENYISGKKVGKIGINVQ